MPTIGNLLYKQTIDNSGLFSGLRKAKSGISRYQKDVKSVGDKVISSFNSMSKAAGISIGVGVALAVNNARRIVVDFEQSIADLASITGKSIDEVQGLAQAAKEIGSVSAFSASQVVLLQTELAKLGFSEDEIIASTKAIGDFSIAVGTDAASAAKLGGAVLRSFGKDASEAEAVVSTLAVATTKSALDFEKLNVSLSIAGPVAKAANVSLERTTSLLGVLADRGLDASTAGSSLRNIFLDLSNKGLTWDQAMTKIRTSTNKLATANELFGKRGATTALILADNEEAAKNLETAITGVDGALQEMTDKRLDTLQGAVTLLTSAWEGLVLTIDEGNGIISNTFKSAIDGANGLLTAFTELNKGDLGFKNFFLLAFGDKQLRESVISNLEETRRLKDSILDIREDNFFEIEGKKAELLKRRQELIIKIQELQNKDTSGFLSFIKDPAKDSALSLYQSQLTQINDTLREGESLGKNIIAFGARGRIGGSDDLENQIKRTKIQIDGYKESLSELSKGSSEYIQVQNDLNIVQERYNDLIAKQQDSVKVIDDLNQSTKDLGEESEKTGKELQGFAGYVKELNESFAQKQEIEGYKERINEIGKTQIDLASLFVGSPIGLFKLTEQFDKIRFTQPFDEIGNKASNFAKVVDSIPDSKLIKLGITREGLKESLALISNIPDNKNVNLTVTQDDLNKTIGIINAIPNEVITQSFINKPDTGPLFQELDKIPDTQFIQIALQLQTDALNQFTGIVSKLETEPIVFNTLTNQRIEEQRLRIQEPEGLSNQGDPLSGFGDFAAKSLEEYNNRLTETIELEQQAEQQAISLGFAYDNINQTILPGLGKSLLAGASAFESIAEQGINSAKDLASAFVGASIAIVKSLIREGIAAIVANTLKGPSGLLGPAAIGVAAAAGAGAAALFEAILPTPPKLATGGIAIGEQLVTVGDNPSGMEAIIPLEKLPNMLRDLGPGQQELQSYIRNEHIYLSNQSAAINYARKWG